MPRLISAVFKPRRGQAALCDALDYLSSPESGWTHIVVDLKDKNRSWRHYGERELYTLFHYKQNEPTDGRVERVWWADYYHMNHLFFDRIIEIYLPGDYIWVHDYHLCLLPALLRARLPTAHIGFFLHTPFPSSELLRCLSHRKEILEGILGATLVGFQSFAFSRHFVSCCKRILGFDSSPAGIEAYGATVAIDVFPIGINAAATEAAAFQDSAVDTQMQSMRELYAGKRIIVGRDRLDSVRGVAQKLQGFEAFLERYPCWRDTVVLIQVTSPTSVEEEQEDGERGLANHISSLVTRINSTYGSLSFSPVQHYPQYISKDEYLALLRVADLGLITSTRDGMSTTSLEYVVCQRDNHGPLILSEFSGTAANLTDAIHINPWDFEGVATAIHAALDMSHTERARMHELLYARVVTNTVQAWTKSFLQRLVVASAAVGQVVNTPVLDKALLLQRYAAASRRLFMFDYDGTLTPIVRDPAAAIPSDRIIRTLQTLAADSNNSVWIISGRDQAFLDQWMGHIPELGLSAEHGCFLRHPLQKTWENVTASTDMTWHQDVRDIFEAYTEKAPGSWLESKKVALTWHYRRADPELGRAAAAECEEELKATIARRYDVEVMKGKANLEVRPRFVNKGEIVKRLIAEKSVDNAMQLGPAVLDFVLCLGDDLTDEDMFRALANSDLAPQVFFTCHVGASSQKTLADWHLLEPGDVINTLSMLDGTTDGGEHLLDGADVDAGVVGLDVHALDLAGLDDEGVALAALVAEQRRRVEGEVEGLGELAGGVGDEVDLRRGKGAGREGGLGKWRTDDEALSAGELVAQLDLVAGRVLVELDGGNAVTDLDHDGRSGREVAAEVVGLLAGVGAAKAGECAGKGAGGSCAEGEHLVEGEALYFGARRSVTIEGGRMGELSGRGRVEH
ncbi:hypothetical protein FH972_023190 [Carpinus fangiana]|uniref:Uncharacterized protein n=1 Tax=Carpinus fangiana TaxID=176857 RepID=A0A5N6KUS9_9ROSI|nr:hypothetical protein FH972_023190 [Carpinus fangiana]